ncbi:MAG TPA: flagellar hook-length control protein FliK [Paenisporosarcina sp.]|nr:flagellar hook-length control protein FliK [Paenisporosarcina sp.]
MISIAPLNVTFQSPFTLKNKPYEHITDSTSAKETVNFAELFGSLTAEGKVVNEKVVSENHQGQLLEKLEEVLQVLQELPQETMSPEQQEMMNAIIQMLSLQTIQMEEKLKGSGSSVEKLIVSTPAQEKLMNLLKQVDHELKELSKVSVIPFEDVPKIEGVEETNVLADPKKFEQVVKQLVNFIQQLETQQQATGKQTSLQLVEKKEQVLNELTSLTEKLDSQTQLTESQKQGNGQIVETSRQVPGNPVIPLQEGSGSQLEPIQLDENTQTLTVATTETTKVSQTSVRTEPTVPTPTVHMSNLIEELGEVLRSTFRLNATGEGTQIKVNIFPEHLGHLDIRITELNGKIAAQIFTSSLVAKEALDLQVNQLRNSLLQQGITIEKIEITQQHSSQSFGQQHAHRDQRFSQQQKQGTASGNKNGYQRMEEEATIERNHSVSGVMKVDYTI